MSEHASGIPKSVSTSLVILAVLMLLPLFFLLKGPEKGIAVIDGQAHSIVVADSPARQYQGLSGKTLKTIGAEGMYFPFPEAQEKTFVMRGMLFALDFLWVRDGQVVKIDQNVPPPKGSEQPITVSSAPERVNGVFEFPAGFVKANGLAVGDRVQLK